MFLIFGIKNFGVFGMFGGYLVVYGFYDGFRGVDVVDFVVEVGDVLGLGSFVNGGCDVDVEGGVFFEDVVEGELVDFGMYCCLG